MFVAVAFSGYGTGDRVMSSPDGITWTTRTSAADNNWKSVTYGAGLFVAVAFSGVGNRVMTSPDGITWTIRASAADNSWNSVTYGAGLFVAIAGSGSIDGVMTSPDGITWTIRTSVAADINFVSVTHIAPPSLPTRRLAQVPISDSYFIRFIGLSEHDETWEFCGVSGIVGEQLEFTYGYVVGEPRAVCLPVAKTSSSEQCYSATAPVVSGPEAAEDVTLNEEVEVLSNDIQLTNVLNYFGFLICFVALMVWRLKRSKSVEFESLPMESAHSQL